MTRDEWVEAAVAAAPAPGIEDADAVDFLADVLSQAEHAELTRVPPARFSTKDVARTN
jgi:hypothetical protein